MNPSKQWYSHKFHGPGVSYEVAVHLRESKIVWVKGPFKAGVSDRTIFRVEGGLKSIMPVGKMLIADNGYTGEAQISAPNEEDTPAVKMYKQRARARHENLNGRLKWFEILNIPFRHNVDNHGVVFNAVCVIVQYALENGSPLFDI